MPKYVGFDKATPIENKATAPDDVEAELERLGYVWVSLMSGAILKHETTNKAVGRVTSLHSKFSTHIKGFRTRNFSTEQKARDHVSAITVRRLGR